MNTYSPRWATIIKQAAALVAPFAPLLWIKWHLAARSLPIPLGDGLIFYTIEYEFAFRGHFAHPYMDPTQPFGGAPFDWHGWLSQLLIGTLARVLPTASAQVGDILKAEVVVMAYEVLFAGLCLAALARKLPLALRAAVMTVFALSLSTSAGRPEVVAQFFLFLGLVAIIDAPIHFRRTLIGVLLGLTAATQPTIGVLAAILLFGYGSLVFRGWFLVKMLSIVALVSACTLAATTAVFHPHGLQDWLRSTAKVFSVIAARSDGSALYYFFLLPNRPLFGFWLLLWPASIAYLVHAGRISIAAPVQFVLATVTAAAAIWFFGFRAPATCYNVMALTTVMAFCVGLALTRAGSGPVSKMFLGGYIGLIGMSFLGVAWTFSVALLSNASGVQAFETAHAIRASFREGSLLEIPPAFALLVPELMDRRGVRVGYERDPALPPGTTFVVQASTGRLSPPILERMVLVDDCFRHDRPSVAGIRIANTPATYEFARYEPWQSDGATRAPGAVGCSIRQK